MVRQLNENLEKQDVSLNAQELECFLNEMKPSGFSAIGWSEEMGFSNGKSTMSFIQESFDAEKRWRIDWSQVEIWCAEMRKRNHYWVNDSIEQWMKMNCTTPYDIASKLLKVYDGEVDRLKQERYRYEQSMLNNPVLS